MAGQILRIITVSHQFSFSAKMLSVLADHQNCVCLPAGSDIVKFSVLKLHISGIIQVHLSVFNKR